MQLKILILGHYKLTELASPMLSFIKNCYIVNCINHQHSAVKQRIRIVYHLKEIKTSCVSITSVYIDQVNRDVSFDQECE